MADGLDNVRAALAELSDVELDALIATANDGPQTAPGFLAWIEHAADWEQHRRRGSDFPLLPPDAAIDPSEDAASIATAMALRELLVVDVPDVAALFDGIVATLTGNGQGH